MKRGTDYSDVAEIRRKELAAFDDTKIIILALHELLKVIDPIVNSPCLTGLIQELEERGNGYTSN